MVRNNILASFIVLNVCLMPICIPHDCFLLLLLPLMQIFCPFNPLESARRDELQSCSQSDNCNKAITVPMSPERQLSEAIPISIRLER